MISQGLKTSGGLGLTRLNLMGLEKRVILFRLNHFDAKSFTVLIYVSKPIFWPNQLNHQIHVYWELAAEPTTINGALRWLHFCPCYAASYQLNNSMSGLIQKKTATPIRSDIRVLQLLFGSWFLMVISSSNWWKDKMHRFSDLTSGAVDQHHFFIFPLEIF